MKNIVTVYADRPDFNYSNALILYSITNIARCYGFKTIIISEEDIPAYKSNKMRVISYINSIPNIIVEKWIYSMNISILLSELMHEEGFSKVLCYGISCLLATSFIKRFANVGVVYIPSTIDISTLRSTDKLLSHTFIELLKYSIKYVDIVFDYNLNIKQLMRNSGFGETMFVSDPKLLEEIILRRDDET